MKNKAGIEIFTSFGISYPEYEVITPQSKKSYTLRSLSVKEEESLKGSMVTASKVARHLAEVLWACMVKKPDDVKTFDDFVTTTTLKDRDALLFGLYVSTYKDATPFNVRCTAEDCDYVNSVKINIEKCLSANFWDEDEIIDKVTGTKKGKVIDYRKEIPLKVFKGVSCIIKTPTMADAIGINND